MGLCGSKERVEEGGPLPLVLTEGDSDSLRAGEGSRKLRFVCVSDLHMRFDRIRMPPGDVLLFAGDFGTWRTSGADACAALDAWIAAQPHRHKLVVSGNHDDLSKKLPAQIQAMLPHCTYLQDSEVTVEGVRVYGAPWTLARNVFYRANSFALRGDSFAGRWRAVPEGIDVLLTHVPPYGVLDEYPPGSHLGSMALRNECCSRIHPKVCVFGHHHAPGACFGTMPGNPPAAPILFVNSAIIPTVFDFFY